jgi:hypothetical protein
MNALAVLVVGYCGAILVGRLNIRSRWVRDLAIVLITLAQVGIIVLLLFSAEPPNLQRP